MCEQKVRNKRTVTQLLEYDNDSLTSLFTALRHFYKAIVNRYVDNSLHSKVQPKSIEEMVSRVLKTNINTKLSVKDVSIAIRVLLRVKPTRSTEVTKKRLMKDFRKQKPRVLMRPHEFLNIFDATENMQKLTDEVEEEHLLEFLNNGANIFLLNYFEKNHDFDSDDQVE